MPCSPFCAGRSLRYNGRMIYVAADHAGPKANCFAFGGFVRPESRGTNNTNPGPALENCGTQSFSQSRYSKKVVSIPSCP